MRKLFSLVMMSLLTSTVFAGPISSGGTQMTENLKSKLKMQAVIQQVVGENEVILSVSLDEGGLSYSAKVRIGEECELRSYNILTSKPASKVKSKQVSNVIQYIAEFQSATQVSCE